MDFFAVLFHWAMFLQVDEPLDPGAVRWLEISEPAEHSEAYIYLLGIDAGANENPVAVGTAEYKKIQAAEHRYLVENKEYALEELGGTELALPDFLSACYRQCIEALYHLPEPEKQLKQHQILLDRTKAFLAYDDYRTLVRYRIESPIPSYHYLVAGNRLLILDALSLARAGDVGQAVKLLQENISDVRRGLIQPSSLIYKMVFVIMLSDNMDMLSLIINEYPTGELSPLMLLAQQEMSVEQLFASEFTLAHTTFGELKDSPYLFATTSIDDMLAKDDSVPVPHQAIPLWWSRIVFKANMSSNSLYRVYQEIFRQSERGAIHFSQYALEPLPTPSTNKLRNVVGSILSNVGSPDIRQYIGRVYDLNTKITLLNYVIEKNNSGNKELPLPSNNPYYKTPNLAYVPEADPAKLCFNGPLPDNRGVRCLMTQAPANPNVKELQ